MNSRIVRSAAAALALAAAISGCREPMFLRPIVGKLGDLNREEFPVERASRVDILWVVDNSLSIDKYRANIAA
ncbi:MAG TPA: hypothetical protein VL588_07450, partial [Bdellovibrionota bacterium]|nr:hypothetical protein [Bdellovibrionota bacterium]